MCSIQNDDKYSCVDIIKALKKAFGKERIPLNTSHELIQKFAEELDNPYGESSDYRFKWAKEAGFEKYLNNNKTKVVYYVGCTANFRQINNAISTCRILEQLGIDFTLISEEVCCGSPFFRIGAIKTAQKLMNKNIERTKNIKKIIFSCAGCYRTYTIDYPKWNNNLPLKFDTLHIIELIALLITDNKIRFKHNPELEGKILTYHDPCHLGRHFGIEFEQELREQNDNLSFDINKLDKKIRNWFEKPRIILNQLKYDTKIQFKEMNNIKMDSICCGAGGGVRAAYPDFSLKTASLRCNEANTIGADILTTECPFCFRNFYDANKKFNHGLTILSLLEMIDKYNLLEILEKPDDNYILNLKVSKE